MRYHDRLIFWALGVVLVLLAAAALFAQSATYPAGVVSFTTKTAGQTIQSAHVNTIQAEITAIENALLNGLAHVVKPLTDATYDLGTGSFRWRDGFFSRNVTAGGTLTVGSGLLQVDDTIDDERLTLTTGVPVTTADVAAATTLYWTPYKGNRVALYDGAAAWNVRTSTELSIAVPATTSQMYDVFVFDNNGTPALELLAWNNASPVWTQARVTALTTQDGIYVKTGATTRRYVGSICTTTVSGQTEDSASKRLVWNYYNRVRRSLARLESTTSWPYTVAAYRQANGAAANQVEVVIGVAETLLVLTANHAAQNTNGIAIVATAIGEDSTTTPVAGQTILSPGIGAATTNVVMQATLAKYPAIGRHFYAWLEFSSAGVGTTTWNGNPSATQQTGLNGSIEG